MDQSQRSNKSTGKEQVKPVSISQSKYAHWEPIISAWRGSGLSQSAFCRINDLSPSRFTYWRAKILGKTDGKSQAPVMTAGTSSFVPVHTAMHTGVSGLRITLPNGVMLSGIDEHNVVLLKALMQAL